MEKKARYPPDQQSYLCLVVMGEVDDGGGRMDKGWPEEGKKTYSLPAHDQAQYLRANEKRAR